ncbi:MAG: hypothetical protein ACREOM_11810 [Candidatus Dormibacteraceae bacterium]
MQWTSEAGPVEGDALALAELEATGLAAVAGELAAEPGLCDAEGVDPPQAASTAIAAANDRRTRTA